MSMNLKIFDMRCFIALCANKNFTKAADKMCISQPPFSRIIQKLEASMGGMLIDRSQNSFTLTTLGEKFLEEAQQAVKDYNNTMQKLDLLRIPKSDDLKVGFTYFSSQIPGFYELVESLSKETSKIHLDELSSQVLCEQLQNQEIDVGILHFLPDLKSLRAHQITNCKAAVLFPQQICCFKEKKSYKVILNEDKIDKPYNQYLLKKLSSYYLTPLYKESDQLSPQLALQGQGILICPEPTARLINVNNTFTLEEIINFPALFGLYLVTHKNSLKGLPDYIIKDALSLKLSVETKQTDPSYRNSLC